MKRLATFLVAAVMVLWGVQSSAAVKWDIGVEVKQDFNYNRAWDLSDDGNNPIATRGSTGSAVADVIGRGSSESTYWLETLIAMNASATIPGLGGNDVIFFARPAFQFDWLGVQTQGPSQSSLPSSHVPAGTGTVADGPTTMTATGTNPFSLWLNQAYVKFVEFNGWPFDITLGRQNIWLGKGFIVGNRLFGSGQAIYAGGITPSGSRNPRDTNAQQGGLDGQTRFPFAGNLPIGSSGGTLHAPQHSDFTGFDAAKIDARWKEWYVNTGWALVAGGLTEVVNGSGNGGVALPGGLGGIARRDVGANKDDEWFAFGNVGFNSPSDSKYRWNAETYIVHNVDYEPSEDRQDTDRNNAQAPINQSAIDIPAIVTTVGLRGDIDYTEVFKQIEKIAVFAEGDWQFGELGGNPFDTVNGRNLGGDRRKRYAWAWDLGADVSFKHKYSPWAGVEGVYFSGPKTGDVESDDGVAQVLADTDWSSWDPVFRGKQFTLIMDYIDAIYLSDQLAQDKDEVSPRLGKVDSAVTNRYMVLLKGGADLSNKFNVSGTLAWAMHAENAFPNANNRQVGHEIDLFLKYKMTKSILWTASGGVFFPGSYYEMPANIPLPGHSTDDNKIEAWAAQTGIKIDLI